MVQRSGGVLDRTLALNARLVIVCIAAHAVAFLGLHVLEPQVSPLSTVIGDYSTTESSWLATCAFVAFACLWATLAVATSAAAPGSRTMLVARLLFALAAVALLVAAVVPESADPRTGSSLARVQNLLARPGLFLAVLLASFALRRVPEWGDIGTYLVGLAVVCIVLLIATVGFLLNAGFGGLGQRALFVLLYFWAGIVAARVIRQGNATLSPAD